MNVGGSRSRTKSEFECSPTTSSSSCSKASRLYVAGSAAGRTAYSGGGSRTSRSSSVDHAGAQLDARDVPLADGAQRHEEAGRSGGEPALVGVRHHRRVEQRRALDRELLGEVGADQPTALRGEQLAGLQPVVDQVGVGVPGDGDVAVPVGRRRRAPRRDRPRPRRRRAAARARARRWSATRPAPAAPDPAGRSGSPPGRGRVAAPSTCAAPTIASSRHRRCRGARELRTSARWTARRASTRRPGWR